ncbi:MAG: VOC family protein [Bacteroidia bacterium]|nr:VOC family protein [Bacteroidia bacterium]
MQPVISGIQQVGVGVQNVHTAWQWFRTHFGLDVPVFEEAAVAELMLPYTGGQPQARHAILAINTQGGGGMEIWQYTGRTPQPPAFEPMLGDLGIYVCRIKCMDVVGAHQLFTRRELEVLTAPMTDPAGNLHLFIRDPWGNIYDLVQDRDWFMKGPHLTGGVAGAMIGVSDMDRAMKFYRDILGFDNVRYDVSGEFADLAALPGGGARVRRVLLTHSQPRLGPFSRLCGPNTLELIQRLDGPAPRRIFENRFWGDLGFIHLCFDVIHMDGLRERCAGAGHPFTVDSARSLGKVFDMGAASGSFAYIEDPDGTLIEMVETFKLPIAKKYGIFLNLKRRNRIKPLPDWMLKLLSLNRVKP